SYFARMKPAFMVSSIGEAAALAALADADHVQRTIETNAVGARLLAEGIAETGIHVTPTWANFLFCRAGKEAASLCQKLQGHGVIVRPMSGGWSAPDAFRVTIGTPQHNEEFLGALKRARFRIPA
ncbi:MAG TPA: aminotransferase class I/II-fold pyridoxal phosphate-dependent enzyme, partial [Terracidiphilus sp.]